MSEIQSVITHIERVYGLELVPCSIPRNKFQYLKRNFYIFIYNRIGENLFYFLRDKVSPIKYLDERPNGEIWFRKRNLEGRVSIEVEIKPIPIYDRITCSQCYKVKIYHQLGDVENTSFTLNYINAEKKIDYYFSKVNELKTELRNYKLSKIL